uniref:Uncharacterized protein n=1 Tax=Anguilla anguilla TaxID=7936 RepID=A0A0E9WPV0_ANGAN
MPSFKRHFFMHKVFMCIGPDNDCLQDNGLVWTAVFTLKLRPNKSKARWPCYYIYIL